MDNLDQPSRPRGPAALLMRAPTGAKVFLILTVALLPLALIALFTTLQTKREVDAETRARLHAVAEGSAGVLTNALNNYAHELHEAVLALEANPADSASCTRLLDTYSVLAHDRVSVTDRRGKLLCGEQPISAPTVRLAAGQVQALMLDDGLALRVGGAGGGNAMGFYPTAALATLVRPSGFVPEYGVALTQGNARLNLRVLPDGNPLDRLDRLPVALGIDRLTLEMAMPGAPIVGPLVITTILLVLMWIAAAGIGWFVVDRLLIRPLRRLRTEVSAYRPGEVIDPTSWRTVPAQEIRDLGNTFRDISRTVVAHEAGLAAGLVRQTRLTREVHHRVKNNLQVIASLINFHARGSKSREATEAYASIQRRVDALAVVHRHHYAEMEENRGLELRSVIGELASNIRATAPETAAGVGITLDIEPFLVTQDTAVAVAFLLTELVELAICCAEAAQIRISVKAASEPDRAVLRVSSPALIGGPTLEAQLESRYGRVIAGLARQLRTSLHHDPLVGAYEAMIVTVGRP